MKHPIDRANDAIVDLVRSAADADEVAAILMTLVIAGGGLLKGHIGAKKAAKVLRSVAKDALEIRVKPATKTTEVVH